MGISAPIYEQCIKKPERRDRMTTLNRGLFQLSVCKKSVGENRGPNKEACEADDEKGRRDFEKGRGQLLGVEIARPNIYEQGSSAQEHHRPKHFQCEPFNH